MKRKAGLAGMICIVIAVMLLMPGNPLSFSRKTGEPVYQVNDKYMECLEQPSYQENKEKENLQYHNGISDQNGQPCKLYKTQNDDTEYWAVLIGAGIYDSHSDENRPSMLRAADEMHDLLLQSDYWQEDHIKVLKGKECTAVNIVEALRWLDEKDDENDISLVYITTHGFKGPDIPPFDESDGKDEYLATYWGFEYPVTCIWDDELNFLLSRLDSKGVAVIIDSCHSGGVGDSFSETEWIKGFAEDIQGNGRVILMSCGEDELSYGSYFTNYIVEGLKEGIADYNRDGMCSAEEAFEYAEPKILALAEIWGVEWHPQIYDGYEGELVLTPVQENINQKQTEDCGWGYLIDKRIKFAQGFVPSVGTLTKVKLYIWRLEENPPSLEVSIRKSLSGENLVTVNKPAHEIGRNLNWVEFDFSDINVDAGQTYYIVCETESEEYSYAWVFGAHNPYPQGAAWSQFTSGSWNKEKSEEWGYIDFCFITYGE